MSWEERQYRQRLINRMAEKMTEDDALVLTCLYKLYQDSKEPKKADIFKTISDIMGFTKLDKNKVRSALRVLEVTLFIEKKKLSRNWIYAIKEEGCLALKNLLNQDIFPGRKVKFLAILEESMKKEGR